MREELRQNRTLAMAWDFEKVDRYDLVPFQTPRHRLGPAAATDGNPDATVLRLDSRQ